jgi:putative transposase
MPRKLLIRTDSHPYHVCSRSNNKEKFYLELHELWPLCIEYLIEGQKKFEVIVDAFVLMPNHYHMLVYTPRANIDKFMHFFNHSLARAIINRTGHINRVFRGSYRWNLIKPENYYLNVIRYIYQNPIRAGLCERVDQYPYSDYIWQSKHHQYRDWFNQRLNQYDLCETKKKLKRKVIELDCKT